MNVIEFILNENRAVYYDFGEETSSGNRLALLQTGIRNEVTEMLAEHSTMNLKLEIELNTINITSATPHGAYVLTSNVSVISNRRNVVNFGSFCGIEVLIAIKFDGLKPFIVPNSISMTFVTESREHIDVLLILFNPIKWILSQTYSKHSKMFSFR